MFMISSHACSSFEPRDACTTLPSEPFTQQVALFNNTQFTANTLTGDKRIRQLAWQNFFHHSCANGLVLSRTVTGERRNRTRRLARRATFLSPSRSTSSIHASLDLRNAPPHVACSVACASRNNQGHGAARVSHSRGNYCFLQLLAGKQQCCCVGRPIDLFPKLEILRGDEKVRQAGPHADGRDEVFAHIQLRLRKRHLRSRVAESEVKYATPTPTPTFPKFPISSPWHQGNEIWLLKSMKIVVHSNKSLSTKVSKETVPSR